MFQALRYGIRTHMGCLCVTADKGEPLLYKKRFGLQLTKEEAVTVSNLLYSTKSAIDVAPGVCPLDIASKVWEKQGCGTAFPVRTAYSLSLPTANDGLQVTLRGGKCKDETYRVWSVQLKRFHGDRCVGVGLEMTDKEAWALSWCLYHLFKDQEKSN